MGGSGAAERPEAAALRSAVVGRAEAAGLRLVRFLYCDHDSVIRGKASGLSHLAHRLEGGIGLTVAMQAFSLLDRLAPGEGMGPGGRVPLGADLGACRVGALPAPTPL